MSSIVLSTLLLLSLVASLFQIARLRRYGSGRAFMASSSKAFRLMRRSFVAVWAATVAAAALVLHWNLAIVAVAVAGGFLMARVLQWLTQSSGLMTFVEAGEQAIAARRAAIRDAGKTGNLFVVRSNGKEHLPKIVPARPDWDALLHMGGERVRSTAS